MGKRFGRNQKRRMRQQVNSLELRNAQLEYSHTLDRHLLADMSGKLESMREFIAEVREIVGAACVIAGEPEAMRINIRDGGFMLPVFGGFDVMPFETDKGFQIQIMKALSVDVVRSQVAGQLHIMAEMDRGICRLALSESAIRNMPERVLVGRLAKDIARQLVIDMRKV